MPLFQAPIDRLAKRGRTTGAPRRLVRLVLVVLLALCASAGSGCASGGGSGYFAGLSRRFTSQRKLDQANTPVEQIAHLKQLASKTHKHSPAEQAFIVKQLVETMRVEPDALVREHLLRTLAKFDHEQSREMMREALADTDSEMRILACELWGEVGGEEAVERLGQVLTTDADLDVRLAAARALGATGDPSATRMLAAVLEDSSPAMQYRAVESLKQVTGEDLGPDVKAWIAYVESGEKPAPPSLAQRLGRWF